MMEGKVKFFNAEKGYGFIAPFDGHGDVFVHAKDLKRSGVDVLQVGDRVRFDVEPSRGGKEHAINISLLK